MNGVELLSPDSRRRPSTRRRRSRSWTSWPRRPRAAPSTRSPGPAAGSSRTAPSPSGNVGMLHAHSPAFFFFKGQGPWVNADTLGVAQMPGNWATPNSHGLGISKGSKNPELAWRFLKHMTDATSGRREFVRAPQASSPAMSAADQAGLERLQKDDPLACAGAADAARAHRQDDRQLAAAATTPQSRTRSGPRSRAPCSAARTPRPRWPTPSGAVNRVLSRHERCHQRGDSW